jgi:hypothetical protein
VASPDLEGGQVAVLRLHAASAGHVTSAAYSRERGECITQMSYLWCFLAVARGLRISENSVTAKFAEFTFHELG